MNRREFLQQSSMAAASLSLAGSLGACFGGRGDELFKISLAEWSVNRSIFGSKIQKLGWSTFEYMIHNDYDNLMKGNPLTNLDFPKFARSVGVDAVEFVNTCFFNKAEDTKYLTELKNTCDGEGVNSQLIMCDLEGALGDPDSAKRETAVQNHYKWVDAAAFLGCHSIRVNAQSFGSYEEQMKLSADGLQKLCEYAERSKVNILVENHGGLSSNGQWLSGVMNRVDSDRIGTLPDFGNFTLDYNSNEKYDRYKGIAEMMPFAKAISAKAQSFDDEGNETNTDYFKAMKIVLDGGYHSYIGIEYEGTELSEREGIIATKNLLERVREFYKDKY